MRLSRDRSRRARGVFFWRWVCVRVCVHSLRFAREFWRCCFPLLVRACRLESTERWEMRVVPMLWCGTGRECEAECERDSRVTQARSSLSAAGPQGRRAILRCDESVGDDFVRRSRRAVSVSITFGFIFFRAIYRSLGRAPQSLGPRVPLPATCARLALRLRSRSRLAALNLRYRAAKRVS